MLNPYKPKRARRKTETSLKLHADELYGIVQTLREPLLILDSDLRVIMANKSFYRKFRSTRLGAEGKLIAELRLPPRMLPSLLTQLKSVRIKKAGFENFEMTQGFPGSTKKILSLCASPILSEAGAPQKLLLSFEDVTARREAEKKLVDLTAALEKRNLELAFSNQEIKKLLRVRVDFSARVSHELRTPLSALKESINIVYQGASGALKEQKMFLEMAKRNIERLGRLVDDVLDFSRLDSGKKTFDMRKNNINDLIREGGAFYGPLAARKGLQIRFQLQSEIPEITFDYDSILQVFINILSNAVKFTERGEILIQSRLLSSGVEISVQDTGAGIAKKDIKRLFQPFEQIEGGSGKKNEGTGLGLTISRQIIEQHRGKISISSVIGKGTQARFSLPLHSARIHEKETSLVPV